MNKLDAYATQEINAHLSLNSNPNATIMGNTNKSIFQGVKTTKNQSHWNLDQPYGKII
jgi:hypothetical protein